MQGKGPIGTLGHSQVSWFWISGSHTWLSKTRRKVWPWSGFSPGASKKDVILACFLACVYPSLALSPSHLLVETMCIAHIYIPNAKPNYWLSSSLQPEKLKVPCLLPPPQEEAFASICPDASASSAFSHSNLRALGPVFSCYAGNKKHRPAATIAGWTEANYSNLNLPWLTCLFHFKCLFVDLQKSNTAVPRARPPPRPWEQCVYKAIT